MKELINFCCGICGDVLHHAGIFAVQDKPLECYTMFAEVINKHIQEKHAKTMAFWAKVTLDATFQHDTYYYPHDEEEKEKGHADAKCQCKGECLREKESEEWPNG